MRVLTGIISGFKNRLHETSKNRHRLASAEPILLNEPVACAFPAGMTIRLFLELAFTVMKSIFNG